MSQPFLPVTGETFDETVIIRRKRSGFRIKSALSVGTARRSVYIARFTRVCRGRPINPTEIQTRSWCKTGALRVHARGQCNTMGGGKESLYRFDDKRSLVVFGSLTAAVLSTKQTPSTKPVAEISPDCCPISSETRDNRISVISKC